MTRETKQSLLRIPNLCKVKLTFATSPQGMDSFDKSERSEIEYNVKFLSFLTFYSEILRD